MGHRKPLEPLLKILNTDLQIFLPATHETYGFITEQNIKCGLYQWHEIYYDHILRCEVSLIPQHFPHIRPHPVAIFWVSMCGYERLTFLLRNSSNKGA